MAVPKKRTSKAKTKKRKSIWKQKVYKASKVAHAKMVYGRAYRQLRPIALCVPFYDSIMSPKKKRVAKNGFDETV